MKKKLPSLVVLCVIGLVAGLLLSLTDTVTSAPIEAVEANKAESARAQVLTDATSFDEVELVESRYALDSLYEGRDDAGAVVGYVGQSTVTGFGGPIEVVTGIDMEGNVTGISVGGPDFAETAGLGAKTKEASFTDQFKGKTPSIVLGQDGVETVTGASTSSRAVISGVNTVANYVQTYSLGLMEEATVYTGATTSLTTQGFGGEVTVNVGFADDGTIEYLSVDTPNETDGLGKMTSESAYTSQFLGKAGPFAYGEDGIEAVTGATITSTAVLDAINEIVSGGGSASAEPVTTTVQGYGGEVTVTARLNADDSIAALSIDTPNETDGLGKTASDSSFTDQFIGKMAPFAYGEDGIEAITGATVTSTAVLEALNAIVPAGDKSSQTPVVEEAVVEETEVPAEETTEVASEAPAEDASPAHYTPGEYTVTKETAFSTIDVKLTLSEDAITDAVITSEAVEGSQDMLTDETRKALADGILAAQGSDIDAITSVTISSDAVKEAVDEILADAQAGGEAVAEEEAVEEETVEEVEAAPVEDAAESTETVEETPAEETASTEETAPAKYVPGEYTVTKETAFSTIVVKLTLSEDAITDAVITSEAVEGSQDMLTDETRKALADDILAAQGSDIDAITSVTISSDAVKEAVDEILADAQAG
ncbi:MAG: FMN-binding protein, partial [Clostridiales bacterium]|nr:FMN-binding protein [Clostridiales bacterium]